MKGRDRNLLILVVVLVSCFAALAILMSGKESKQSVLSPIIVPVRGWFSGNRGWFGGNRGTNSNTTVVVGGGNSSSSSSSSSVPSTPSVPSMSSSPGP